MSKKIHSSLAEALERLAEASERLDDVQAVSLLLSCSARHVYRLSDSGKMPGPVKLGSLVRWSHSEIENWIAAGCPSIRSLTGKKKRT